MAPQAMIASADVCSSYYLRIDLRSGAQGLPELDQLLCNAGVQLVQKELLAHQDTPDAPTVLLLTAPGPQYKIDELIAAIELQAGVVGAVKLMRVEHLN